MTRNVMTLLLTSTLWVIAGCEQRTDTPAGQLDDLPGSDRPAASPGFDNEPARPGAVPGGAVDRPGIGQPADPASPPPPAEPAPLPPPGAN